MLIPLLCAALVGAGLWLVVRGLSPAPPSAPRPRRHVRRPWRAASDALAARLALADLPVTPARFALAGLGLSLATGLVVGALTGLWLLALAGALGAGWLLATWLALRAGDRARRVDLDLEIAIGQMGGLIAEAGAGLVTTLDGLAARGPASLRPAFAAASAVALLGGLRPGATAVAALRLLNAVHEATPVGRFLLAEASARLLFEAELVLGPGDDRRELVARLLPALLLAMRATIADERPRLAAVVDG